MQPKNVRGAEANPPSENTQKEKKAEPPAKKKLFPYAIACTCWAAKQTRAALGQETTEHGQSKKKLKHFSINSLASGTTARHVNPKHLAPQRNAVVTKHTNI